MSRKTLVPLVLPADPAAPMEAVTKQYVDAAIAGGSGGASIPSIHHRRITTGGQSIATSAFTTVLYETPQDDVGGITYNAGTGIFTVPANGTYFMSMGLQFTGSSVGPRRAAAIQLNSNIIAQADVHVNLAQAIGPVVSTTKALVAGDQVKFAAWQNSGAALLLTTSGQVNWASMTRVDTSTPLAFPWARIIQGTNQSIPTDTQTTMQYQSAEAGSTSGMGDFANNRLVIPNTGLYAVEASMFMAGATTTIKTLMLMVNGGRIRELRVPGAGVTSGQFVSAHRMLNAGDLVTLTVVQTQGSAVVTSASAGDNSLAAYQLR